MGKKKRVRAAEIEEFRWKSYFQQGGAKKFVIVGMLLFVLFSLLTWSDWKKAEGLFVAQEKWHTTQGTIFHNWLECKPGGAKTSASTHLYIRFLYEVQGTQYIGDRIGFDGISSSRTMPIQVVRNIQRQLAVGNKPTVYYLPWKPQVSVLNLHHKNYGSIFAFALFSSVGLCILLFGVYGHIKYSVSKNIYMPFSPGG